MWCIMKVHRLSNIPNTQSNAEIKGSPKFKGKSDWSKVGKEVAKKSKFMPKALTYLGQNDGEILNTVVTAVGTSVVAPIFIIGNPISKEDKETKWYSAMRQPISAVIALVFQLYVNNVFNDWMARSASTGRFGERFDLSAMPKAKYLKKIIELEHPDWDSKMVQAEIDKRQAFAQRKAVGEMRIALKDKSVEIKELISADSLNDARKDISEEIEKQYKDELAGKSKKAREKFIESKITNEMLEERAIKDITASVEAEAKSKFKIRELENKFKSVDEAIKHMTELKPANKAEKKFIDSVLERLDTIKIYEQSKGAEAFSSVKDLGKTYEKVLHNVKIKRLVKARTADAAKSFSQANKWAGIFVSLVTLPFSCGLLNWAYPRVMEKIMPKLQPWIHRNNPDWSPEKAKKYGPPEKLAKVEDKPKVKVEVDDEEDDDE